MLVDALMDAANARPSQRALHDPTTHLTFRQLLRLARAMRDIVSSQTKRPHVGLMLPGSCAMSASFYGTLWAKKVAVPLNFLLNESELAKVVADADLGLVLTTRHFNTLADALPARSVFIEDLHLKRRIIATYWKRRPAAPIVNPDALAVLLYTSGSSGACKGVELSQRNLHSNAEAIIQAVQLRDDDRFLALLPPFHVFGLTANIIVPIVRKLPVHILPRFSPTQVLHALQTHRPTIMMAIPSMYAAIMRAKHASPDAIASLRYLVSGGEPLPPAVAQGFHHRFGAELLEGYGLTETSPVVSLNTPEHHRTGTVGKPLPNVRVRLMSANGSIANVGEEGEIQVRGPSVMRGYHNRPEETLRAFTKDGYFATGDLGRLAADGWLTITGRKSDLIIVGGENVYPREVECVLEQHASVREAVVVGVANENRGEAPVAAVILDPDLDASESELRAFARQRLAGYKVPKQIRVFQELPRGPTGKVLRRELRVLFENGSRPGDE